MTIGLNISHTKEILLLVTGRARVIRFPALSILYKPLSTETFIIANFVKRYKFCALQITFKKVKKQ